MLKDRDVSTVTEEDIKAGRGRPKAALVAEARGRLSSLGFPGRFDD
jgi:hypothetical protein